MEPADAAGDNSPDDEILLLRDDNRRIAHFGFNWIARLSVEDALP